MRRSSGSIPDNITEGSGTETNREFARYLKSSIGSTRELQGQLDRARKLELLTRSTFIELETELIEIRKMLYGFLRRVQEG